MARIFAGVTPSKAGVKYEALDNGLLRCSDPKRAQALADSLSAAKIGALVRKWFKAPPHPFPAADRRVSALRFGDGRVQALLAAVLLFVFVANGFRAKELRPKPAALLGLKPDQLSAGRVTYDLRRLRLHGLIERLPRTHRYRLTQRGIQIAAFWTRTYNRLLRPGLAQLADPACESPPLRRKFDALASAIDRAVAEAKVAA